MSLRVDPDPLIPPLQDWFSPLAVIWDLDEDPAPVLAPYFCCIVEAVSPHLLTDPLTARQWDYAKELLDRQPQPPDLIEWESRWRNFLEYVWTMLTDHQKRAAKAERARTARLKKLPPAPVPPAAPSGGGLEL